jgi:hypothetical protein
MDDICAATGAAAAAARIAPNSNERRQRPAAYSTVTYIRGIASTLRHLLVVTG